MPFRATKFFDRFLSGQDTEDALRQACLCIDRELDEILAFVNTQNVTGVRIAAHEVVEVPTAEDREIWNPDPFPQTTRVPRYIELIPPA